MVYIMRREVLRENVLERFNETYIKDMEKARKIRNTLDRLCALEDRLLILENDERTAGGSYSKSLEESEERRIKNLNKILKPYGLSVVFCSHLAQIGKYGARGCIEFIALSWY